MRTRGRVDNRNDYEHKSLNKTKRQRELLRVTHENQVNNITEFVLQQYSHFKFSTFKRSLKNICSFSFWDSKF